jgi:undecaprenyl-phosphate 4-deoxy-4-formamido-L-arabinose transferase
MRLPSVSVVVPVYRGSGSLPELVRRLESVLTEHFDRFEVILVNDGSPDRSWDVIRRLAAERLFVRGINLMRNYGQHSALLCGILQASGDLIVTMDDDLQHRPEDIPLLLAALSDEVDVVYGTPDKEHHGLFRGWASRLTKTVLKSAMGAETARLVSAFRLFRARLRDAFDRCRNPWISIDVLLTWGTTRFCAVTVPHEERRIGPSNYTFRTLMNHALNMMTGYSVLPLRLASLAAFVFMFFGFGILAFVVGRYLFEGSAVPGFPMLASIVAILGGVQLFALGILGEYLARMHVRMMDSPPFVVKETTRPLEPPE